MKKWIKYILAFLFAPIAFPIILFLNWKNKDKDYKTLLIISGVGLAFAILGTFIDDDSETIPINKPEQTIEVTEEKVEEEKDKEKDTHDYNDETETKSEPEPKSESKPKSKPKSESKPKSKPKTEVTRGQRNALQTAETYIESEMGFSEKGLREQLEFEEYKADEVDYALKNIKADWNKQAEIKAKAYEELDMGFSDQGLIEQLVFEGFTQEQAQHGLDSLE